MSVYINNSINQSINKSGQKQRVLKRNSLAHNSLAHNSQQGTGIAAGQKGFVLVLSLVMLAVLTLIGVSSMNTSNMELRATANSQQHQVAFNAAQSALEFAISKSGEALIDYQTNDPTPQKVAHNLSNASALSATAVFAGCSVGVGSSLEAGKGFSYNFFNITGRGSNATGTATSTQGQGVRYPAASC